MNIHQLISFVSVFKNRSFSTASKELRLTQPTISSQIKALEKEFDCSLFDRMGKTIIPTKEAEILYGHSVGIIDAAIRIREAVGKMDINSRIVIGASSVPEAFLLPHYVTDFRRKNPSIFFQVHISDSKGIVDSISRYELILGVVGAKFENEEINYIPFVKDELIVVASPSLSINGAMTLREITKLPMVLREEGSGTRKETESILNSKGISLSDLKVNGIFGSMGAVKQAVREGFGVSVMSKFSVAEEIQHKILKEIKLTDIHMKRLFYIVTRKNITLPRAYDTFLKYVLTEWKNP